MSNPIGMPIVGEPIITKTENSAFIVMNLKELLNTKNCNSVVIVGLTTDHSVPKTTRMAGSYVYDAYLVSDGTLLLIK